MVSLHDQVPTSGRALTSSSGKIIGVWLKHNYAHTQSCLYFQSCSLRGVDMVLLETVRALSLEYAIVPVIGEPDEHPGDEKYCYDGMFFQH